MSKRYKYFRFRRPYWYFRFSVVVSIISEHFLWTRHGRKLLNCCWNFDAICHSSRDISIFGLGDHVAISGCRSLLLSFGDTVFDVAVVGKLDFVTWITTILRQAILDLFCHISQHDHKISPVSKTFTRVWRHAKQLLVHRLAICLLHFVPTSYSGKVTKGQRPMLNRNFLLIKKLSWGLFYPKSIRELSIKLRVGDCFPYQHCQIY